MVKNGKETTFWKDVWLAETPLKTIFPKVCDYCKNKNSLVSECNTNGLWGFDFTRTFSPEEMQEWGELLDKLKDVTLGGGERFSNLEVGEIGPLYH